MIKQLLHQNWTVHAVGNLAEVPEAVRDRDIPATVPGCIHTDLLAAGLIPDPYLDRNELAVQWIGRTDWRYTCRFTAPEDRLAFRRIDLVCEGLDTVARLELNGYPLGIGENMHCTHRFDAKPLLRNGDNELSITFYSAAHYARVMRDRLGDLPNTYPDFEPYNFIRKMACNFGWDWGPTLITCGIWKPICLELWDVARIKSVRPSVQIFGRLSEPDEMVAVVDVQVEIEFASGEPGLGCRLPNLCFALEGSTQPRIWMQVDGPVEQETLLIKGPQLWWPRGYGEQPLYQLRVILERIDRDGSEDCYDEWEHKIGLREVRLNTQPDEIGSAWTLEVNGQAIWCKGANWIPDDCFPTRVDEARYRHRIEQAIDANMNILRIWGGGIYESDTFYDICDELGVLVWQDFLFACAAYPEEEPMRSLVEAEARQNIARLSRHPSLVLWNGCNENIWGYFDWGWKEQVGERTWGLGYYLDLLPRLVQELDPSRPYWPGSPYSGTMALHPLDDRHGNKHIWDAWNQVDYTVYRDYTPRFVSEFGHQAPPTYATLARAIPQDQRSSDSPAMLHHQKANGGNDKLNARLAEHFPVPSGFDDWLYLTQLNQARAMTTGVEWFRSRQQGELRVCTGAIYWQINDCWPVTSWAAVDGDGRLKPLWYATRRFFADRLLTIQPEGEGLALYAVNDTGQPWQGDAELSRRNLAGETLAEERAAFAVPLHSCRRVCALSQTLATPRAADSELVVAQCGPERALWFFERDKNLAYPAPDFETELTSDGAMQRLTVHAKTLLRDVCVFVDRLDSEATVHDQLVTLLPGESFAFEIAARQPLRREALIAPPVFQCANRFGRG